MEILVEDSNPRPLVANSGEISLVKAPQSLSLFHRATKVWQAGFLFFFSVQFDGKKPDKITLVACACNNDVRVADNSPAGRKISRLGMRSAIRDGIVCYASIVGNVGLGWEHSVICRSCRVTLALA